jgi:thioredoxin 1
MTRHVRVILLIATALTVGLPGCGTKTSKAATLTSTNFDDTVLRAKGVALVDFWGDDCPPCRAMDPVIKELASEFEGQVTVGRLHTNEYPDIARRYEIEAIPTFIVFKNGQIKQRLVGVQPKHFLANLLLALR